MRISIAALVLAIFSIAGSPRSAFAVDFGWTELPDGGIEYRLQIQPELFEAFRQEGFTSEIPPDINDIRRIRISTGNEPLPNQGNLQGPGIGRTTARVFADPESRESRKPVSVLAMRMNSDIGWEELSGGGIEYLVQVQPERLDGFLKDGFTGDVPPGLRDVRRIRITAGKKPLPNQGDVLGPIVARGPARNDAEKQETKSNDSVRDPVVGSSHSEGIVPAAATGPQPSKDSSANPLPPMTFNNTPEPGQSTAPKSDDPFSSFPWKIGPGKGANAADSPNAGATPPATPPLIGTNTSKQLIPEDQAPERASEAPVWEGDFARTTGKPPVNTSASSPNDPAPPAAKPWFPLMLALLALFASLGANIYLVWIHQHIRAKYFALVRRTPEGAASGL